MEFNLCDFLQEEKKWNFNELEWHTLAIKVRFIQNLMLYYFRDD